MEIKRDEIREENVCDKISDALRKSWREKLHS